jgi:hypothetical protein
MSRWTWWHMPVIPELRRLSKRIMNFRPAWATSGNKININLLMLLFFQ